MAAANRSIAIAIAVVIIIATIMATWEELPLLSRGR
jgi:hypothetical protein